MNTKDRQSV